MPFIDVTISEGREPAKIRGLMRELHEAAISALGVDPNAVRVVVREVSPEHWQAGGITLTERRATEHQ